jgi:hypothetical protein
LYFSFIGVPALAAAQTVLNLLMLLSYAIGTRFNSDKPPDRV